MKLMKMLSTLAVLLPSMGTACGADSDCMLDDGRHYRISLPQGEAAGAILFAHGFGGSAKSSMSNIALRQLAADLNLSLITVKSAAQDWSIPNAPGPVTLDDVDEIAYIDDVMEDVQTRFAIEKQDTVMSGFSAGSMLVWTVACQRGSEFAGYVPMSGVFWSPIPESCPADAASVIHIHGDNDKTVPLAGRKVMDTRQGDVLEVLEFYKGHGSFSEITGIQTEDIQCSVFLNPAQSRLEFCQFAGGHQFRADLLREAHRRLAATLSGG